MRIPKGPYRPDHVSEERAEYVVRSDDEFEFVSNRRSNTVIDNAVIDLWLPVIGTTAYTVYSVYCRLERAGRVSGLNQVRLARSLRIGTSTLQQVNELLEDYGFVTIIRPSGTDRIQHRGMKVVVEDPPEEVPHEVLDIHRSLGNPEFYQPLAYFLARLEDLVSGDEISRDPI